MHEAFSARMTELQRRMADDGLDAALLTDADSIYYLTGYWGYLGTEFGRPTLDALLERGGRIKLGVERLLVPALIAAHLRAAHGTLEMADATRLLAEMRMIKSAEELAVMRQAGQVAVAMAGPAAPSAIASWRAPN